MLNDDEFARLQDILASLKPNVDEIYPSGRSFVQDQFKRFEQYGQDIFMSKRQWDWLIKIEEEFGSKPKIAREMSPDEAEATDDNMRPRDLDDEIPF